MTREREREVRAVPRDGQDDESAQMRVGTSTFEGVPLQNKKKRREKREKGQTDIESRKGLERARVLYRIVGGQPNGVRRVGVVPRRFPAVLGSVLFFSHLDSRLVHERDVGGGRD